MDISKINYNLFSPLFSNLFENKVVYYERYMGIVKLKKINMSEEYFEAIAVPYLLIERDPRVDQYFPKKQWTFSAPWSNISQYGTSLVAEHILWGIWCAPELVKNVEALVKKKQFEEVLKITLYENV